MRRMRQSAKVDDNQAPIVKALRDLGCYVHILGQPFDILVGWRGTWTLIEVKDGSKEPARQKLTWDQVETLAKIRAAAPVYVARNVDEALCAIGAKPWPEVAA